MADDTLSSGTLRTTRDDDEGDGRTTAFGKAPIRPLLALLLLVNLAASLYQLPLNRVVESRLCHDFYRQHNPALIEPDGGIDETLCKIDEVQKGLGRIQGVMETAWIVGGELEGLTASKES